MKYLFYIFCDALKLDIFDCNYLFSSEKLGVIHSLKKKRSENIIKRFFYFFGRMFFYFFKPNKKSAFFNKLKPIIFFSCTNNQTKAIYPLYNKSENSSFVGYNNIGELQLPMGLMHFLSLLFFPILVFRFIKSKNYRRRSFTFSFEKYLLTYGYYLICRIILRKNKTKILVLANDHSLEPRTFAIAATHENIQTIYLQHASVNNNFPPLMFTYAFLFGLDSLMKYNSSGISKCKCYLTGMYQYDDLKINKNKNKIISNVGYSINVFDDFNDVCIFLLELVNLKKYKIFFRPHPSELRKIEYKQFCKENNIVFSDSITEPVINFIMNLDLLIAGNSSIHLEAAINNVVSVYYYSSESGIFDYYNYLKDGLIEFQISNIEGLQKILESLNNKKPNTSSKIQYYSADINTKWEGKSAELASILLFNIYNQKEDENFQESRIENVNLKTFQII